MAAQPVLRISQNGLSSNSCENQLTPVKVYKFTFFGISDTARQIILSLYIPWLRPPVVALPWATDQMSRDMVYICSRTIIYHFKSKIGHRYIVNSLNQSLTFHIMI